HRARGPRGSRRGPRGLARRLLARRPDRLRARGRPSAVGPPSALVPGRAPRPRARAWHAWSVTSAPVLPGWRHVYSGKVRDLYEPEGQHPDGDVVLVVASDRISAYDFVLETPIPDKGVVLTQLSLWWFEQL